MPSAEPAPNVLAAFERPTLWDGVVTADHSLNSGGTIQSAKRAKKGPRQTMRRSQTRDSSAKAAKAAKAAKEQVRFPRTCTPNTTATI